MSTHPARPAWARNLVRRVRFTLWRLQNPEADTLAFSRLSPEDLEKLDVPLLETFSPTSLWPAFLKASGLDTVLEKLQQELDALRVREGELLRRLGAAELDAGVVRNAWNTEKKAREYGHQVTQLNAKVAELNAKVATLQQGGEASWRGWIQTFEGARWLSDYTAPLRQANARLEAEKRTLENERDALAAAARLAERGKRVRTLQVGTVTVTLFEEIRGWEVRQQFQEAENRYQASGEVTFDVTDPPDDPGHFQNTLADALEDYRRKFFKTE